MTTQAQRARLAQNLDCPVVADVDGKPVLAAEVLAISTCTRGCETISLRTKDMRDTTITVTVLDCDQAITIANELMRAVGVVKPESLAERRH